MIKKLILKNFLAHAETEIEFSPGLNVLSGPNNTGKSAVVEALRCLAENPVPQHFIRHGEKEARVTAVLENDVRVTWIRRKAYAMYEVQKPGQEKPDVFAKFGRRPPDEIRSLLRLEQVEVEGSKPVDVHIGNQREPVFLFRESGPVQASFFASSTESAHLLSMQKKLVEKERTTKRERKRIAKEMAETAYFLDQLAPLPEIEYILETCARILKEQNSIADAIATLQNLLQSRNALHHKRHVAQAKKNATATLSTPPQLWPTQALASLLLKRAHLITQYDIAKKRKLAIEPMQPAPTLFQSIQLQNMLLRISQKQHELHCITQRYAVLKTVQSPPVLFDAQSLHKTRQRLLTLKAEHNAAIRKAKAAAGLVSPPALTEIHRLQNIIEVIRTKAHESKGLQKKDTVLATLAVVPQLHDISALASFVPTLKKSHQQVETARERVHVSRNALAQCRAKIEARLAEIGRCPLCGGDLDAEHTTRFLNELVTPSHE